jgi:16S rRNA (guanine527-N7)-methyltransferase
MTSRGVAAQGTDDDGAAWRAKLAAGAATLGVPLDAQALDRLWRLALALRERNQQVNLTAIDDLRGIRALHVLDSLSVVPHLGDARRVLDVGTGGGFPGLPLAIACPQVEFTLIDGTQKKIRFVADMIEALGLPNATALAQRAENFRPAEPFDAVVIRAVGPLGELARRCRHLVRRGGPILALKGRRPDDEVAALPAPWRAELIPLAVPEVDAERHLAVLRGR